jgi:leucyl-tRNA synthetase
MSKSRGNVVAPDSLVKAHGADALRAYLMFAYRWNEGGPVNTSNIQGVVRWLNRMWSLVLGLAEAPSAPGDPERARALQRKVHQTIRQVSNDLENYEFNTVVSGLMELTNAIAEVRETGLAGGPSLAEAIDALLLLAAPVVPHLAEELWARRGKPYSIHNQPWPEYDPGLAQVEEITLVVQVNGKVRDRIQVPADIGEAAARQRAMASQAVQRLLAGREPKQVVFVPGRLVNIVV